MHRVEDVVITSYSIHYTKLYDDGQIIADLAKGIEPDTLFSLTEVIRDVLNKGGAHDHVKLVALSGPTHAEEVAQQLPTTT